MSRYAYYTHEGVDYDMQWIGPNQVAVTFRVPDQEAAMMRKPRSVFSSSRGTFQMRIDKVERQPGPPVNGESLYTVTGRRLLK